MITELTVEQEALIPMYQEKWRAIALSTERINQQRVYAVIASAYSFINRKSPNVIFSDSPYKALQEIESQGQDLWEQLFFMKKGYLRDQFYRFEPLVEKDELWLHERFQNRLMDSSSSLIRHQLQTQRQHQIPSCIRPERWIFKGGGFFDFCVSVLQFNPTRSLNTFLAISETCGWIYPFEEICFVCDRPTKLSFDDQDRLHAEGEPAIEFADSFCVYAHYGELITEPHLI